MIVSAPRDHLWAFLNERNGTPLSTDLRCIGLVKNDCLVAVAGYNGWVGKTCYFQGAIDYPEGIDRTFIRAIFEYPFLKCGVTHMLALVSEHNEKSLSFCARCGFRIVRRLRKAAQGGEDLFLLELLPDECRWLNGKEKLTPARA